MMSSARSPGRSACTPKVMVAVAQMTKIAPISRRRTVPVARRGPAGRVSAMLMPHSANQASWKTGSLTGLEIQTSRSFGCEAMVTVSGKSPTTAA